MTTRATSAPCRWALDHRPGLVSIPRKCASTSTGSVADPPPLPMPVPYYAKPRRSRQPEKTDAVRRLLGELPLYP